MKLTKLLFYYNYRELHLQTYQFFKLTCIQLKHTSFPLSLHKQMLLLDPTKISQDFVEALSFPLLLASWLFERGGRTEKKTLSGHHLENFSCKQSVLKADRYMTLTRVAVRLHP